MTGEITLHGNVLPIGGLREKSMAAYREGMKTVLIPKDNEPDLYEVDDEVKKNLTFLPMQSLTQVLNAALLKPQNAKKAKAPMQRKRRQTPPLCRPPPKSPSPARCAENRAGRQIAFSANSPGLQSRPNACAPGPHPQDIRWRNSLPSCRDRHRILRQDARSHV
jgi:hypothetical protein